MYTSMTDDEMDRIQEITDNEMIRGTLNTGSIDHPSDLLIGMMRHPLVMLRLMPLMFKAAVR
jgi:hypothetical protein